MPRNPNVSYEKIAHYLSAVGKPATINDMCSAGIVSRNTAYRLLIDYGAKEQGIVDVPMPAKLHGIFAVGKVYPTHYVYHNPGDTAQILDPALAKQYKDLHGAATLLSKAVEDMPPIDQLDRLLISAFQKHRLNNVDETLRSNFVRPQASVEQCLELFDNAELRKVLIAEPIKFRTLLISMFVSSYNESENSDD